VPGPDFKPGVRHFVSRVGSTPTGFRQRNYLFPYVWCPSPEIVGFFVRSTYESFAVARQHRSCEGRPVFQQLDREVSLNLWGGRFLYLASLQTRDTDFRAFPIAVRSFDFPDPKK
jgi:hypothetical protein